MWALKNSHQNLWSPQESALQNRYCLVEKILRYVTSTIITNYSSVKTKNNKLSSLSSNVREVWKNCLCATQEELKKMNYSASKTLQISTGKNNLLHTTCGFRKLMGDSQSTISFHWITGNNINKHFFENDRRKVFLDIVLLRVFKNWSKTWRSINSWLLYSI